jgi:PAS domain S-box-containing protein
MDYPDKIKWTSGLAMSVALRYGLSLVSVATAVLLAREFLHFHLPQPFAAFALSAIAITFWYAGTGPGTVSAVLSSVIRSYFFEADTSTESRVLYDLVFLVFAVLMTRVARARDDLEMRVAERTAELTRSNGELRREIAERTHAEYLTSQVFESSPDAVSIVGTDYRYKRVNPVYQRNWGKPVERIVGMHVADLWGAEVFERKNRPYLDRCFAGENVSFGDWFDNALGRRYLVMSYSPLRSDSQRVEAALVISRDLTEHTLASEALRLAQADLAHASRLTIMGELTASLAHEVNQPIAAAVTSAGTCFRWLTREDPDLGEARQAVVAVVRNAKRAADIINHIRSMSKKGESKRQLVDLNELIRDMTTLLRNEANRYSISIRTDLDANLPKVIVDSVQVQQVMMNLIMNSIDALKNLEETRAVSIKSQRGGNQDLVISVSDNGVGLPPKLSDRIFDAFFTTKSQGIGLGLRISRTIVEAHGGRLWATDNPPRGASFYFTLPSGEATENGARIHTNV